MNLCNACEILDGMPSSTKPHPDLHKEGIFLGVLANGSHNAVVYRCGTCRTAMRQYSERGEIPNKWIASVDPQPVMANGYEVSVEIDAFDNADSFGALCKISHLEKDGQRRYPVPSQLYRGYKSPYAAAKDALAMGVAHAKGLPPG